jgi:DedD protein
MDPQLKQRLIGAAVLIALAIIFVPMLLSGPAPKDSATVNLEIPPPPEREFQTRVVPADGGKASVPTPAPTPAPAATHVEPDKVATVEADKNPRVEVPLESQPKATPPAKPAEVATAKPATKPTETKPAEPKPAAVAEAKPALAAEGRFLVHLGVFGNAANASNLVASAKKLGLPSMSEAVDGKAATRVRLGPFANRAAAEAARLKFKEAEPKVAGSVIEIAPAEPKTDAPATALAANHAGGWAVQLGAFKQQDEANKLRDRVKNAGFAVFVEPVGQGAERLWRVRVGPEADRGNAEKARDAIKAKLALNGTVVTQS